MGHPTGLARHEVVNALEPESFKPARGSWTQISLVVEAVDNHRARLVESLGPPCAQILQREIDRAGNVFGVKLFLAEDLNEQGPLLHEPLDFDVVNIRNQSDLPGSGLP